MPSLAPVALFTYNRPEHTEKTLTALKENVGASETELFIFSDGSKDDQQKSKVDEVRRILRSTNGFLKINLIEREKNLGLAQSVILGVTEVFSKYESIIVLEDDIVTSPDFLRFMNQALNRYGTQNKIFSVSGFNFPVKIPKDYPYDAYLSYRSSSWGWGTWKNRWAVVDWEAKDYADFKKNSAQRRLFNRGGDDLSSMLDRQMKNEINSWAIRWCYAHFKNKAYGLSAVENKVENIGFDGSGTHCAPEGSFSTRRVDSKLREFRFPETSEPEPQIAKEVKKFVALPLRGRLKALAKSFFS